MRSPCADSQIGILTPEEAAKADLTAPAAFARLERRSYDDTALIVLRYEPDANPR